MIRATASRWFLPVLGLPLAFAACTTDSQDLSDETVGAVAVSGGGGVTVDVLPTMTWPAGFVAVVRVTNTGFASPISTYEVVFKLGGSAGVGIHAANGIIMAPDSSGNNTATSPDWLPWVPIQVGQSFDTTIMNRGADFIDSTIVSVKVNGTTIPIGTGG
jgi:hypothetical protein